MNEPVSKFEALVYTENRAVAVRCAEAFADFPVDWMMFDESSLALEYLSKERFDYVVLDLDSGTSSILVDVVSSGINLRSVVLALTLAPVDPGILNLCYNSQVFYPVRPSNIEEELYRSVPFAERISVQKQHITAGQTCSEVIEDSAISLEPAIRFSALFARAMLVGKGWADSLGGVFRMKHSLSIVAQEWVSSILACIGTMWFVQEITVNFNGIEFMKPPSAGPTYLIALALLLWLCAKQRRTSKSSAAVIVA